MKEEIKSYGDKVIWFIVIGLPLLSTVFVYSGLTIDQSIYKRLSLLFVYAVALLVGLKIEHKYYFSKLRFFKVLNIKIINIIMFVIGLMLFYLFYEAQIVGGTNTSRFMRFYKFGIQPSSLAMIAIVLYAVNFVCKVRDGAITLRENIWFWCPILLLLFLIFTANLSTAVLIFGALIVVLFFGGYPLKNICYGILCLIALVLLFVVVAKIFPDTFPNRIDTWLSRIIGENNSQIESAKIAIYEGGFFGNGIGSGVQKYFLPERTSDFMFALMIEEVGLFGSLVVLFSYYFLAVRLYNAVKNTKEIKEKMLIVAMGVPIFLYVFTHIFVNIAISPVVTGQNLPLVSSGGTSLICTGFSLGVILRLTMLQQNRKKEKRSKNIA